MSSGSPGHARGRAGPFATSTRRGSGSAIPTCRAPRRARDPACVEGRADRADARARSSRRSASTARAEAVPLPPGLSRAAGGGEVRGADPVRGEAPRPAARDGRASDARSARSAARLRRRDPAHQPRLVPHRLRPAHEAVADLRRDDAEQVARQGARHARHIPFPREGQGAGAHGGRRHRARRVDPRAARDAGPPPVPVRGRRRALQPDRPPAERVHPRVHGRRFLRARTSAPGAGR